MEPSFLKAIDLIYLAKQQGVEIILNNEQLQLKVQEDLDIDKTLLEQIKANKKSIIEFLSNENWKTNRVDSDNKITRFDRNTTQKIPLSYSQERLWFIDRLEGSVQYHVPTVLWLKGSVNKEALAFAFQTLVNRHEVLRSVIREEDGKPYQHINDKDAWELTLVNGLKYNNNREALQLYITTIKQEPFVLSKDYMLRAHLISLNPGEHVLVVTLHHIASDGWSVSILVKEVVELYASFEEGRVPKLEPLEIQYADYAMWQRKSLDGNALEKKLSYWKDKLQDAKVLRLPTDFVRPTIQSTRGAMVSFKINKELSEQLQALSQRNGATMFMTILAGFKVLLHRYSGQQDIVVGSAIAGRQQRYLDSLIGFFVNTLALRSDVNDSLTFVELLQQVRATTLAAYEHQEVPFEKVVEAIIGGRDMGTDPLVQVMFGWQNTPDVPTLELGEARLSLDTLKSTTAMFELFLNMSENAQGLSGYIEYSTDLYSKETVERMMAHFKELLTSVVQSPEMKIGFLSMLSSDEKNQLLHEFNDTKADYPKHSNLASLFEEQSNISPDQTAVVFGEERLTYKELNDRSNQLANYLITKGIQPGKNIGLLSYRGIDTIIAMFGILKAGCVYVPLNTAYPADRIKYIIDDAGINDIVYSGYDLLLSFELQEYSTVSVNESLSASKKTTGIQTELDSPVYIMYTSGTTGRPKGILVSNRNVIKLVYEPGEISVTSNDRILQWSNYAFDGSVYDIYSALLLGASLYLIKDDWAYDVYELSNIIESEKITVCFITTALFNTFIDTDPTRLQGMRKILFGGEMVSLSHVRKALSILGDDKIIHVYGPTETTVYATSFPIREAKEGGIIPIGKPLANTKLFVLSSNKQLVPVGVPGELYIGGDGISLGYLNRPELTDQKFVADLFDTTSGGRLYRTGDLVRWSKEGNIEFLGRLDEQVKIRGYRIELGEIESVLLQSGLVNQAVVLAKEDKETTKRLVGYIVPSLDVVKIKERELYSRLIASWKELYETEYGKTEGEDEVLDEEFNLIGWNDSFTGGVIPEEQMREWLEDIMKVIYSVNPERVLEIGSGTGLIYYQLAGKIKKYIGTDFSKSSINQISQRISKGLRDYGPTELQVCAAHEVSVDPKEEIDTIILNSIIQYFPGEDYMTDVISKSISILKGNGRIIIGDVRDNRLLELFKGRLNIDKLQHSVSIKDFKWIMEQESFKEEELCFSPDYFLKLQLLYPQITHVEIKWKQGNYINELTLYRFTVILYVGTSVSVNEASWKSWDGIPAKKSILQQLEKGDDLIALKDVPNPRLSQERLLYKALQEKTLNTVGNVVGFMAKEDSDAIVVEEILNTAKVKGYHYKLLLHENPLLINLLIDPSSSERLFNQPYNEKNISSSSLSTNIPLFTDISALLQKDIRSVLQQSLPEYMIPSELITLGKLPLTANGKVDRIFLTQRQDRSFVNTLNYQPPRTNLERSIATIWQDLLAVERIGIYDNFFELGGHSLLAMRVISSIRKELEVELVVKDLFVHPTIAELGLHIETHGKGSILPPIHAVDPRPDFIPLSFSQERLWFIDQLEGSLQYHMPSVFRLKGELNREALLYSLQNIVNRHEVLRSVIKEREGKGYQFVKDKDLWELSIIEGAEYKENIESLHLAIKQLIRKPFDLSTDFMIRAHLICLSDEEHVLVVTIHHIASDAWSISIIVKEVVELYNAFDKGQQPQLTALPIQYADYAIWQQKYLQGELLDYKLGYWRDKLKGVAALRIPADFERPAFGTTRGASTGFRIDKELSDQLEELTRQAGTTLFMTLLTALKILLHRYSGQQDICVGTSIASRQQQETEALIGFFINTLALRTEVVSSTSFIKLLQQVKTTTLEAYEHQEVPFEKVVDAVVRERDPSRSPLFQVMLVLHNTPEVTELRLGKVKLSGEQFESNISKFDITFFVTSTPNGLQVSVQYSTDLYAEQTMHRMIVHFKELLKSIVKAPQQKIGLLPMLIQEEHQQFLGEGTSMPFEQMKGKTIVDLFVDLANKIPDEIALVFEEHSYSYRALNERSNQIAHYLRSKGIREDSLVPLCVERSHQMIIGLLGILKAGAAYVPIEPDFPEDRKAFVFGDTKAKIVISTMESSSALPIADDIEIVEIDDPLSPVKSQSTGHVQTDLRPEHLAYVIYTSGSTGKPKGVMIGHYNLVDYVFGLNQQLKIEQFKSYALVSSIATDLGNTVIYSSLVFGGSLHVFSKESVSNIEYLHQYFRDHTIECLKIVPSHWKALSLDGKLLLPSGLMVFGGESLHAELIENIRLSNATCRVVNHYGPTETSIGKLLHEVQPGIKYNQTIPIGKPFSNTRVYVLSKELGLCPISVAGELHIAGDGVARGYLNNEELTTQKFISNPFDKDGKSLMYRTGDLVRYLADGNIEFIGRVDDQVKIRGYRVELGEIETVLQQHEEVGQGVVLAREDKQGNKRLIAYVVTDGIFDREGIITYLNEKLPEYMVPSLFVEIESFPMLPNGKIDRKSLPDPDVSGELANKYEAPRTDTELRLADIWQDVLEVEQVGINDDFFELGGHSLLAVRLISAIRKEFVVEMPIGDIFDYPTIKSLAEQVEKQSGKTVLPSIIPVPRPEHIPLSFSQERLWFIDKLEGSVQYHRPAVMRLRGTLNIEALNKALKEVMNRHEVFRTVFREEEGQAFQVIKDTETFQLVLDQSFYKQDLESLDNHIEQLIKVPFDLSKDDMMRAHLITLNENEYVLVVTMHHIASDGWSISIFVKEIIELYKSFIENRLADLSPLPVQYADFAIWQRNYLQQEVIEKKIGYWKNKLHGVEPLELPTDYPRPAVQSRRGAMIAFNIDSGLSERLQHFCQQQGATLFMTLLASFKVLLYRYSGQEDICVGSPIAGRQQQELEKLIGFFINTLVLRSEVKGNTSFSDLLKQVKRTMLEAYENQEVPFEKVVDAVVLQRDMSRNPLFQVMFILQNTPDIPELHFGEVQLSREGSYKHTTSLFDLTFSMLETPLGLQGVVEYCTDLYREETILRMVNHYKVLLQSITSEPLRRIGLLEMLTKGEEHQLRLEFNKTVKYPQNISIVDLFEQQVEKTPGSIAIVFQEKQITYRELSDRSNQFASYLKLKGIHKGQLVPICMERSIEIIIGIWGILKAGGAYVPIDPTYPHERIDYILNDIAAPVLITDSTTNYQSRSNNNFEAIDLQSDWATIANQPVSKIAVDINAEDLCYIIYTSGSTGKPKGVMIEHKSLVASTLSRRDYYTNMGSVFLIPSIAFDSSVAVIFGSLVTGGKLIVCRDYEIKEPPVVKRLLAEANTILCVPSYYRFLLDDGLVQTSSLANVIVAGEKLDDQLVSEHYSQTKNVALYNEYGPTEGTVWSTVAAVQGASNLVTIGTPINSVDVYILDRNLQLVPLGVTGELCIGGVQVARGYLNLPELTDEKFSSNPFIADGTKMYRTGDMCRWLPDGNIEFLGRKDDQVKIRGFRIELGEIEQVLLQIEGIRQAVVIVKDKTPGNKLLVAYVVAENFNAESIKENLKERLPDYMIPTLWVPVEVMPLTPNGKIDRKALPDPDTSALVRDKFVAARNELEITLVHIWQQLLGLENIGIHENYFDIGGHSMLAVQLISAIRKEFSLEVPLKEIFDHPTVESLATYINSKKPTNLFNNSKLTDSEVEAIAERLERIGLEDHVNFGGQNGEGKYIIPIQKEGMKNPLFGLIFFDQVRTLGKYIGKDQPLFYLPPVQSAKVEDIAAHYVNEIKQLKPEGPYHIAGYCGGGKVAVEIAQQLQALGNTVSALILLEFYSTKAALPTRSLKYRRKKLMYYIKRLKSVSNSGSTPLDLLKFFFKKSYSKVSERFVEAPPPNRLKSNEFLNYQAKPYTGKVILIQATNPPLEINDSPLMGWANVFTGDVKLITVPGGHLGIFREPDVQELAKELSLVLEQIND